MIEQKTFVVILSWIMILFGMVLFCSAPSLVLGTWNFHDFIRDFLSGIVFGAIAAVPFWLAAKYVKRE